MAKVTDEDMKVFKPVEGHRRERVYEHDDYDVVNMFEASWILKHEDFDD